MNNKDSMPYNKLIIFTVNLIASSTQLTSTSLFNLVRSMR